VIGVLLERIRLRPLRGKSFLWPCDSTLAWPVIRAGDRIWQGTLPRSLATLSVRGCVGRWRGANHSYHESDRCRHCIGVVALCFCSTKTSIGRKVRALAADSKGQAEGIRTVRMSMLAWGLSAGRRFGREVWSARCRQSNEPGFGIHV